MIKKLRAYFQEVLRIKTSPHAIAFGFAIGTLISILPTPGFNILIGTGIVLIFKRVSKISMFLAMAIWNPIVLIPFYYLSYWFGNLMFGSAEVIKYNVVILDQIYNFSRRFLIGNMIVAVLTSVISYILVRWYWSRRST